MELKSFLKTKKGIACIAAAAVILVAAAAFGGYEIWLYQQPKFHDLTVELGTESISLGDFMTEYASGKKVSFASDPAAVDLNRVGETELTLKHGGKEETVVLSVQDTIAPTAKIQSECTVEINAIPEAKELVSDVEDASKTEIYYRQEPVVSVDYSDVTVTVVVEDACGNSIEQDCVLRYRWIPETYALELGDELTAEMLLLNPERDSLLLDQAQLDPINTSGLGEYTVTSTLGDREQTCTVTVADTKGPELELSGVQRYPDGSVEVEDFIKSVTDVSEVKEVRLKSEFDVTKLGTYPVVVEAEDIHGNITTGETTLWITNDMKAPELSGDTSQLTVEKHSTPDFLEGFSATDDIDGECEVVCDTSKLDLDAAGTYYITYSASDKSGNVTSVKRKVVVNHDWDDTIAMVQAIADTLSDDPEEIRDYVRRGISYSHDWGGEDPVWYGFTTKTGNCYVHAMCLKTIFDLKGIESQLIWVTNETHYWLIVKIGDVWRHIDATPGVKHTKYSLMDDQQRLATLSGRVWDTTQWPACE